MSLVILPSYSEEISNNDTQQYATGLIEPTEEQLAAFLVPENEIAEVKLNADAIEQIQNEANGPATYDMIPPAEPGHEVLSKAELENLPMFFSNQAEEPLPRQVDNSNKSTFPSIGNQEDIGSCTSWAVVYYQLTNNTARIRNKREIMSPGWMYDLVSDGEDLGASITTVGQLLYSFGCEASNYKPNLSFKWPSTATKWEAAIANKINRFMYLDIKQAGGIDKLKRILLNGDVVNFSTYINSFFIEYTGSQFNRQAIVTQLDNEKKGPHAMTVVGYNDSITAPDGTKGAFKVANSWGSTWENEGYIWITYDCFINQACSGNIVYYIEPRAVYTPLLIGEINMNIRSRRQVGLSIKVENSETMCVVMDPLTRVGDNDYSFTEGETTALNYPNENRDINFNATRTAEDATVMIDLTPFIISASESQNGAGRYQISVLLDDDVNDNLKNSLKGFKVIDRVNNKEFTSTDTFPKTADGSTVSASVDCDVIPKILTNNQTLSSVFTNDIPSSAVNSSNIYCRKLVKSTNRYGENKFDTRLNQVQGNKVSILPASEDKFPSWTYYRAYFAPTIGTSAGNILGERKKIDFYVAN